MHTGEKPYACEHCRYRSSQSGHLKKHVANHERQQSFQFPCRMQDGGTQLWAQGNLVCSIRCKNERDMEYHVERNHTVEGIGKKLHSETKLAEFFTAKDVPFDRDWTNRITFNGCKNIEGGHSSARPDFFLPAESARLGALVLVGNDEFAHRQYACDFQRVFNITQALEQHPDFKGVPLLYLRFNPHHYWRDAVCFSQPLHVGHELLLSTLRSITEVRPGVNLVYVQYDRTEGVLDIPFRRHERLRLHLRVMCFQRRLKNVQHYIRLQ